MGTEDQNEGAVYQLPAEGGSPTLIEFPHALGLGHIRDIDTQFSSEIFFLVQVQAYKKSVFLNKCLGWPVVSPLMVGRCYFPPSHHLTPNVSFRTLYFPFGVALRRWLKTYQLSEIFLFWAKGATQFDDWIKIWRKCFVSFLLYTFIWCNISACNGSWFLHVSLTNISHYKYHNNSVYAYILNKYTFIK